MYAFKAYFNKTIDNLITTPSPSHGDPSCLISNRFVLFFLFFVGGVSVESIMVTVLELYEIWQVKRRRHSDPKS